MATKKKQAKSSWRKELVHFYNMKRKTQKNYKFKDAMVELAKIRKNRNHGGGESAKKSKNDSATKNNAEKGVKKPRSVNNSDVNNNCTDKKKESPISSTTSNNAEKFNAKKSQNHKRSKAALLGNKI